jgi:DNA-binding transcriptional ArsR family regulator
METSDIELDLRPEYCHFHDEGCELASSCLNCSLPKCIYDQPRGKQRWLKKARDREITRRFATGGKEVSELALEFGISQRTVQRALKKTLNNGGRLGNE